MQEEVENRTLTLVVSGTKFTGRLLKAAISKYMAHCKEKKLQKQRSRDAPVTPHGKQTVKQLIGQNQGISNIEITDPSIKEFEKMPEYLKSAVMTAEWENQLLLMEKGEITDTQFMGEITSLVRKILEVCREIPEEERRRFQMEREVIGKCPVCGCDVFEGKQNFYCSNRQCDFALWKENRFLGSMEKNLDKKMARELLDKACSHVKGLYSKKKDMKFDADLLLTLEDGKPRFHLEFPKKKKK